MQWEEKNTFLIYKIIGDLKQFSSKKVLIY